MKEERDNKNNSSDVISTHIFIFPFRLKSKRPKPPNVSLKELKESLEKSGEWKQKSFDFKYGEENAHIKYNEWFYFHDAVRETLFGKRTILYFERRDVSEDSNFILYIKKNEGEDIKYELQINHISLRLIENDTGILTIELKNKNYPSPDDILIINDFGRRIYPQFIGKQGVEDTKRAFLPNKIELKLGDNKISSEEFRTEDCLKKEIRIANYIGDLIKGLIKYVSDKDIDIIPIIDDRMFVVCWYGNDELSKKLSSKINGNRYLYELDDWWYKYIYVDGKDKGVSNENMKVELIKEATYDRWVDYNTLYGISRYSFVCITDRGDFGKKVIKTHMETIYYQMVILLLAQRALLLKFSDDITRISEDIKDENIKDSFKQGINKVLEDVEKLYSSFIRFEAMIHFVEVTPQEQGIEMYNMAYKNMRVGEMAEKIRYEIEKIHEFVQLKDAQRRESEIFVLEFIGVVLAVISVVLPVISIIPSIIWKIIILIITIIALLICHQPLFSFIKFIRGRK